MFMKVVLLHDWLTGFRGGERVLEVFCEMFPDAPLYTLIHQAGSTSSIIENRKITASFLNGIPGVDKHYRKLLPLFPKAVESLKIIEEADLVLSSSHCVIKGVEKPVGAKHLCYIHSPMRYMYDQYENYFGPATSLPIRMGGKIFRNYLTNWDIASNRNVDQLIANSNFVQQRITKYYGCESKVVHPFVDLADFKEFENTAAKKDNFYLMVTAFAPNKRVDLAIEAFNLMELPLKIIGKGQEEQRLKEMAGPTIEFLGAVSREMVVDQMSKAQAFIFPGVEDFGITPLESLASGTPVIAYKIGGVLETLNEDVALFFERPEVEYLIEAVKKFEEMSFSHEVLVARAQQFSKEQFIKKIQNEIEILMRS